MAVKRSAKDLVTVVFTWRGKDYQISFDSQKDPVTYFFLTRLSRFATCGYGGGGKANVRDVTLSRE